MKVPFALPFIASTACGFVIAPSSYPRQSTPPPPCGSLIKLCLFRSVEEAIEEAQRICAVDPASQECKVAWDIVEELEAADSHRGGIAEPYASSAVRGGTDSSDDNSVEVSALLGSFDILMKKIDGKMDQLQATTVKFNELGATDPSIEQLWTRAGEMKQALADARENLYK